MVKKIAFASDHAGLELKKVLIEAVQKFDFYPAECIDLGCHTSESVDYPCYAKSLASALKEDKDFDFGVLICGSGIGISIAANRFHHIRCALIEDSERAALTRQHNDANVIAFGSRFISAENAVECLRAFLKTPFEGQRHKHRVDMLSSENTI